MTGLSRLGRRALGEWPWRPGLHDFDRPASDAWGHTHSHLDDAQEATREGPAGAHRRHGLCHEDRRPVRRQGPEPEGVSGTTMDRLDLRKLRDLVNANTLAAVIVHDPDRLSR
jgi:hypothetical protein